MAKASLPNNQSFTNLPFEVWKPVLDYEDRCEVSNLGRVRTLINSRGRLLPESRLRKLQADKDGYTSISLYRNRKGKLVRVARLVLQVFDREPEAGEEASHLNDVRSDNRIENLIWETRQANEDRKTQKRRRPLGSANGAAKLTEADVIQIRALRLAGYKLGEIGERFFISESQVSGISGGRFWKHLL